MAEYMMEYLMYFNESAGGAQVVDKTNDYTAYFITNYKGLVDIEINDPDWCTTTKTGANYNNDKCFIRYKFKSGLKVRVTISLKGDENKNHIYSIAFGGILSEFRYRVAPIVFNDWKYIYKYDSSSIRINNFIINEVKKIDKEKLDRIISKIIKNNWNRFLKRDFDEKDNLGSDLKLEVFTNIGDQGYVIRLFDSYYYMLETIPYNLKAFKESLDIMIKKNGNLIKGDYFSSKIHNRFRVSMKIKYLKIRTENDPEVIVDYLNKLGVFNKISVSYEEGDRNIEAEFKDFTLTLN